MRIRLLAGMRDKDLSRELQINDNITNSSYERKRSQLRTRKLNLTKKIKC